MKVLTLWQPWASLIALGEKRFETRSWPTKYRGPIAIHAAKKDAGLELLCHEESFRSVLNKHGVKASTLPLGAIVAVADLISCTRTDNMRSYVIRSTNEYEFGDYTPGRFAFELSKVVAIDPPVTFKGVQGLSELPPDVVERLWERLTATRNKTGVC